MRKVCRFLTLVALLCFAVTAQAVDTAPVAPANEIAANRKLPSPAEQHAQKVSVSLTFMEVSLTKLREMGIKLPPSEFAAAGDFDAHLEALKTQAAFYEDLKKRGLVHILAEPKMITASGRKAHFASGSVAMQQKQKLPQSEIGGAEIDALPMHVKDDAWQVDLKATVWEIDQKRTRVVEGQTVALPLTRQTMAVLPMRLGETRALHGLIQLRRDATKDEQGRAVERLNQVELVVLVTLRPVDDARNFNDFRGGKAFRGAGQKFRITPVVDSL